MSGILDTKQRILDTIVTLEGRRQIVSGKFQVKFVSFSDKSTFYAADLVSGSADANNRLFLEECHLPQDSITFEADDSGKLVPFPNASGLGVLGGTLYSGSSTNLTLVSGSDFASLAEGLITSSIDNFKNLYSIGTIDSIFEDDEFLISETGVNFNITDKNPINDANLQFANVNQLESFFQDRKLSNIPNFRYLPPVNKLFDTTVDVNDPQVYAQHKLGTYVPLGNTKPLTINEIKEEIQRAESVGNVKKITFEPTNFDNSLAMQIFELQNSEMLKLDVIDFGTFKSENIDSPNCHVLFVGKVFLDDFGTHTFVRIFTILLE